VDVGSLLSYTELYEKALDGDVLVEGDARIFDELGTNFERILSGLLLADRVMRAMNRRNSAKISRELYERVQAALAAAVKEVHLSWNEDSEFQYVFDEIGSELRNYRNIYSTNYDVLVYWSILKLNESENDDVFKDCFFSPRSDDDTVT